MILDTVLDPSDSSDVVQSLEAAGFGCAWVTETVRDPYLRLAAAAGVTTRMALGTGVAVAFARSPMLTALSAHDIQRASGGRFLLGLGSQVRAHVIRRFSMPWSRPAARMREYVLALRAIWASWNVGAPLDFEGEFYTHTLMTPFFNPGPTGFPAPPILLGGVGERMTTVAGEVADGFICGPLTSALTFRDLTLPALRRGLDSRDDAAAFSVCVMPLVVTGTDAASSRAVAAATRARIAFYASTPAYRPVLEQHGWEALHERLHELSSAGAWTEMAYLIDDDVLEAFAVVAEPDEVASVVRERFGEYASRAIVHAGAEVGPDVWATVCAGGGSQRSGAGACHAG